MSDFGKNLKRLRKARSLTQKEVARACGFSPAIVGLYENGDRKKPSWEFIVKASKLFEVKISELTGEPSYEDLQDFMKLSEPKPAYGTPFTQDDIRRKYRTGTDADKRRIENAIYALFDGEKTKIKEILTWLRA